jgi:hypothetical protein
MVVIRCGSDEGAIGVNGNGVDIVSVTFQGMSMVTDLLPG